MAKATQKKTTYTAVLNPKTARVIDYNTLYKSMSAYNAAHPKVARALGGFGSGERESIYALLMGYNVISETSGKYGYHNVIDRTALVYKK